MVGRRRKSAGSNDDKGRLKLFQGDGGPGGVQG